jgi:hypothetical protein
MTEFESGLSLLPMAKKTKSRATKKTQWENVLLQMAPHLAQMLSEITAQNAKVDEKKVDAQLRLAEAQCKLADALAGAITTFSVLALRHDAKE